MATSLLLRTNEYKNSIIVRTRDAEIHKGLDLLCDVGGTFDHATNRFDHHQKVFDSTWLDDKLSDQKEEPKEETKKEGEEGGKKEEKKAITKLSSAGLIYKFFGKEVIRNICKSEWKQDISDEMVNKIWEKLYKVVILEIDAIDTGVNQADDLLYSI